MSSLPLAALRAFAAVFETGGVRPAARVIGVNHSAVSRHLRELEAWMGVALLETRDGQKSLKFTPQGEALGRAAVKSFSALTDAVEAARESRAGNALIIATTPSFAVRWLIPRLYRFQNAYPRTEISVIAEQRPLDLDEQKCDLAIRMGTGPWANVECKPFMDDELFPVCTPGYWAGLANKGEPELGKGRLIHDRDPVSTWAEWFAAFPTPGVNVRAGPRFTSSDLTLRAAAQGFGLALARGRLASDDLASGTLIRPIANQHVLVRDAYWLLWRKGRAARPREAAFLDWLLSEAAIATAI